MEDSFRNRPPEELISNLTRSTISPTVRREDTIHHRAAATVPVASTLTSFIIADSMRRDNAEIIYDNKTSSSGLSPILGAIDVNIEVGDAAEDRSIPELQLSPDLALPLRPRQHHLSLDGRIERDKPGFLGELFVLSMLPEILITGIQLFKEHFIRLQRRQLGQFDAQDSRLSS